MWCNQIKWFLVFIIFFSLDEFDIVNGNNPRLASAQQAQNTASLIKCSLCEAKKEDANDECLLGLKQEKCESEYCYIHISDEGVLRRGCVGRGDKHVSDPKQCDNQKDKCVVCSDRDNCNNKSYQLEYCFKMKYTITNAIPPNETMSKECQLTMDQLGCYHLEKEDDIEKGCLSETSAQIQQECQKSNECDVCFGKNCNSKVVRHLDCYHCDNTTDINCAEPSNQIDTEDFSHLTSSCLVGIDKNGLTHRSWGSNKTYDNKRFPKGVELCYNDLCNFYTYPSDRLKCYQCHGNAECNLNTPESKETLQPNACRIYSQNERCFIYSDEGKVHRGCLSDETETRKLCEKHGEKCKICKEYGCNDEAYSAADSNIQNQFQFLIKFWLVVSGLKMFLNQIDF